MQSFEQLSHCRNHGNKSQIGGVARPTPLGAVNLYFSPFKIHVGPSYLSCFRNATSAKREKTNHVGAIVRLAGSTGLNRGQQFIELFRLGKL
jgi:hypothetical protein